jgi:hypothetical protein
MRTRALLLFPLVLCALVAAACGAAGDQPTVSGLVASSIRAAADQKDLEVHYDVSATISATPSAQASADTRKWLSAPLSLTASGGVSKDAVTLAGNIAFMGSSYRAEALLGRHEEFINVLGSWYGGRTKGLADAQDSAEDAAGSAADRKQAEQALRWAYDHADQVLDAQVSEGPDIDGATWQAKGHCDPDGLAKLAEDNGQPLSAHDRESVATFCRLTDITYVAGADDHLPRELRITADVDKATLETLAASSGDDSVKELDRLKLELDVKLTQWGKDVTYTAPAHPKSIDDLGQAVIGLLFKVGA